MTIDSSTTTASSTGGVVVAAREYVILADRGGDLIMMIFVPWCHRPMVVMDLLLGLRDLGFRCIQGSYDLTPHYATFDCREQPAA